MELVVAQKNNETETLENNFLLSYELSPKAISRIEKLSTSIDANLVNMKTQWIAMGQSLTSIQQEIKDECLRLEKDYLPIFNEFVLQRFGRKHTWAANSIQTYERFKNDTLIDNASITVLGLLNPLPDHAIDQLRKNLKPDQPLTVKQVKEFTRIFRDHQESLDRNNLIEQELAEMAAEKEKTKKQLHQAQMSLQESNEERQRLDKSNADLMQSLRIKQQEATNILANHNQLKQEKEDALRRLTELHKPQPATRVEIEVPPKGYTEIQDALTDILEKRDAAQAELNAINAALNKAQHSQNLDSQIKSSLAALRTSCLDLSAIQTATLLLLPTPITASQRTSLVGIEKILQTALNEIQQIV